MTPVEPVDPAARTAGQALPGAPGRRGGVGREGRRPPVGTPWPELLDALEERTRRLAAAVDTADTAGLPDAPPPTPDGPLPPELEFRARVLLAETQRLAERAERRKAATERELHYSRG